MNKVETGLYKTLPHEAFHFWTAVTHFLMKSGTSTAVLTALDPLFCAHALIYIFIYPALHRLIDRFQISQSTDGFFGTF